MGSPPATKLKKRVITWTSILIVLVIAFFGMLKLGMRYSSDILYQLVKNETNGYYLLSFEKIDIDVWNRAIDLRKVILKPDSAKDFHAKGLSNLYDLELAGLHIDLESITSIYTDRELVIENVRIIDPQIHIIRERHAPDESFSLQTGNLYHEISDYLEILRIDFFSIENAQFAHSPSELGIGNIDFSVGNLLIDSTSRSDQQFYSESIELEILDQSFKLGDSIHQLSFDRLLLSTTDSVLTFENLVLKPISESLGSFGDKNHNNVYDISIPVLKLKGLDYFSAYQNNSLDMKELSLIDAHILFEEQTYTQTDQDKKKGNSLFKQLIEVFDVVKIGKMRLINTNLDITTNEAYNHNYQHVQSKRADIVLYNFILDSSNHYFDHRGKYFDDIDIIIKDYSSYLPDSIHTINFELLQMSSFDSSLLFRNFKISNHGKGSASDMFLTIDLPLLSLKGLNYLDLLVNKKLIIEEMRLQEPNITFEKKDGKVQKQHFSPKRAFSLIKDQFKVIDIKKVLLNQGVFSINKQMRFRRTDLRVSNFIMDHKSRSWYDVIDGVELKMRQMVLKDEKIQLNANHIKLDRMANRLVLDDLSLNYLDSNKSVSGDLSSLTISGINLDSLSMGKYLAFNAVKLINPEFEVDILKVSEGSTSNPISGNKVIEVVNGQINGKTYDATAFSIDKINTKLTIGALNLLHYADAEQIIFTLPKAGHKLTVNELSFSELQDLNLRNIELWSLKDTLLHKLELNGSIPALTFHGLNQALYWEQNKLEGDSLVIETPNINLNLNDIITAQVARDTFEVAFQKVILDKAQIIFSDKRLSALNMIKVPELSLTLDAFQYPQKSVLSTDYLMYADDVTLNIKDFQPVMANGDSVVTRQFSFNKKDALILVDSLSFDQANNTTSALFPNLKLVGLDLHAYLNEKRLKLDSIQMVASQISIDIHASKADKRTSINSAPASIDIKYFSSVETEIELRDSLNPTNYVVHQGEFEVHKFYADGEIILEQFFNYAQFAAISGKTLSVPLGDGYQLSIDQYDLQHPKNTLTLGDINLTSAYTANEYSSNLTSQNDWFDVSVDEITFSGLDFERSLGEREYYTEKILLNGLKALVYRDKSVPFHASKVKALPQSILRNIDAWFYVDTLQVKGDLTYQEKPADKDEIAELSFNSLDAYLFQITSVDSLASNPMQFVSKGQLADTANFEINVLFDMHDPKDKFTFTGQVDRMKLGALNKMLRPVANINIKDGYAEQIKFDITANNDLARGEMAFRYNNLKIQILNKETHDLKGLGQGIKTFFANTFVVKHKNPNFIFLRPGKIFQQRDSTRAIFHYWGKALLSGAVSSVGIHKSNKADKKYDRKSGKKKP